LFWNSLDTCNANPIQEKIGLIVLEFSRHMQCKSNPGEKEILGAKQPTVSCFQTIIISFCGEALKTNKSVEPFRNMDPAFFFVTTLRLIAQKSISTTKQFKGKQKL
jgi:hypothetical protein